MSATGRLVVSRATRRACLALLACVVVAFAQGARAQEAPLPGDPKPSEWKAMERIISAQRAALVAGEGVKAFAYASPGIRAQFGDPETFLELVRTGYAPLLTARYVEFLPGAVIDGTVVVPLRLIDTDNTVRVALYILERQKNGEWRIAGCRIAPSTTLAT
ncbi:MAG: DUF4864 domain-containing protein [Betaproteobacteria bacterium]